MSRAEMGRMGGMPRHWWSALAHPWTWRMAWRDSRAQRKRLVLFSLSIVAGMAALVAIHALRASVEAGVEAQAKSLLGSDLHISSRQPIGDEVFKKVANRARRAARETAFSSMLYFSTAGSARLVQVRGVEGEYPFYGTVETEPADAWGRLPEGPGILLEPALLDQFGAQVGDKVKLGTLELPILGIVRKPPPRGNRFSGFAPEVYVRLGDLERTGLLSTRSLASYHVHLEVTSRRGGAAHQAGAPGQAVALRDAGEPPRIARESARKLAAIPRAHRAGGARAWRDGRGRRDPRAREPAGADGGDPALPRVPRRCRLCHLSRAGAGARARRRAGRRGARRGTARGGGGAPARRAADRHRVVSRLAGARADDRGGLRSLRGLRAAAAAAGARRAADRGAPRANGGGLRAPELGGVSPARRRCSWRPVSSAPSIASARW